MVSEAGKFDWHRPSGVAMSIFVDFVNEATARIGAENTDLLQAVDVALNAEESLPAFLSLTESKANELADKWCAKKTAATVEQKAVLRKQYLHHLSYIHEIAYRRDYGPALFERRAGVTPCPDFLPCTSQQVPARRFGLYTFLNRLWNWGSLVTIAGLFPMVALPFFVFTVFNGELGRLVYALVACGWLLGSSAFLFGWLACRSLRGRCPQEGL